MKKDLLIELYSSLKWDSEDPKDRDEALRSRIILFLDQRKTSPIFGRLKTTGRKKTNRWCLTLTNFNDGLEENGLLGEMKGKTFRPGVLRFSAKKEPKETLNKGVDVFQDILLFLRKHCPSIGRLAMHPKGISARILGLGHC